MVIIMLDIGYEINNRRLFVSYEDNTDEGLYIYSKQVAIEQVGAVSEEDIQRRTKEVEEFGSIYGFEITEDLLYKALSRYNNFGSYSNIVAKAIKDITSFVRTAEALKRFILNKSKSKIGDGWQCLCEEQRLALELLCCMAYKDYSVAH